MTRPRRDQFRGCVVGQCVADALGSLVEGEPPTVCGPYVDEVVRPVRVPERGRGRFPFGQYTDDSQLARELLLSWVERGGFDPADYAGRIARLFAEDRVVGRGLATDAAARRLAAGTAWNEAGEPPPSAGNGTAMRAGPVGLMCFDDPETLLAASHDQSRITHLDARCSGGAVVVAGAVALAMESGPVDPGRFVGTLADWAGKLDERTAAGLRRLPGWLELEPEEAAGPIAREGVDPELDDGWPGISPFVTSSVLWSLYAFLRTPDEYVATVATAIAVGGDVDTTGAMAGAVSGARLGVDAVPAVWAKRLTDQGIWGLADLAALADRAWDMKCGGA